MKVIILAFFAAIIVMLLSGSFGFMLAKSNDINHSEHQAIITRIDQLETNTNAKIDDMHNDIKILLKIATARNDLSE